jgi:hypothetical protein
MIPGDFSPRRGYAAVARTLMADGAFVEAVFHCPRCQHGGTTLIRPAAIVDRGCQVCGGDVVLSVVSRFDRP